MAQYLVGLLLLKWGDASEEAHKEAAVVACVCDAFRLVLRFSWGLKGVAV